MPSYRQGKPAVYVRQAVAQSIPAASNTPLVYGTTIWSEGSGWDGVSSFTCDRPGKYLFIAKVGRSAVALSSPVTVRARLNGVTFDLEQTPATTSQFTASHTTVLACQAGDVIQCNVSFSTTVAVLTVPGSTSLIVDRIGPERWTG